MTNTISTLPRVAEGRVTSDKMQKTVTVLIERRVKHPVIGKVMIRSKKYHAHDEDGVAAVGDLVQIQECAPVAKTKAWKVIKIIEKSKN
jgi:small subunit ribosomal protein S17